MRKRSDIAGPYLVDGHYMLPAMASLPELLKLAGDGKSFVVYAPRHTGKTTLTVQCFM